MIFPLVVMPSTHPLLWYEQVRQALVVSLTAFHARTFGGFGPDTSIGIVAALEGICGLVMEALFVAMLVQRFFSK